MKTVGGLRKTRHRGTDRVGWMFTFAAAAYNGVLAHVAGGWGSVAMPRIYPKACLSPSE